MTRASLILGDSLEILIDNRGKNPPYSDEGVPVISGMSVGNGRLDLSSSKYVTIETWRQWMPSPLRKNDVIMTSEAPLGRVALVENDLPLTLGQRLFALRGQSGVLDSRFLFYAIQTTRVQADLQGRGTGTTVVGIRQPALMKVEIPAPSFEQQLAIAEVLGALDDKIAANTKLSESIDGFLAAKLAHALRRDHTIVQLGRIASVNAVTLKPVSGDQIRYVDIAAVGVGVHDVPEPISWDAAPSRARRQLSRGDTLWSTVRPNRRSHSLNLSDDANLVASTGLAVLTPTSVGFAYLYEVTKLPEFTTYLETVAEGSTYPAVRADRFERAEVPLLGEDDRNSFEALATPLREYAQSLGNENRSLSATRDALLPQLMSGQLRVRDVEKTLETVL